MPTKSRFVTRGGDKLAAALDHFQIDVADKLCADLGSHAGGFVDCLLKRGARRVYSVDKSYGTLAWELRKDPRVTVIERTNAMHVRLAECVDLVTIDVGWTKQERILPNAAEMLLPDGRVLTLIKPHYEAQREMLHEGVLPEDRVDCVVKAVAASIQQAGWRVLGLMRSPISGHGGNREVFALLQRALGPQSDAVG